MRKLAQVNDYTGKRVNSLTGIRILDEIKFKSHKWLWRCDCGAEVEAFSRDVRMNRKTSCNTCSPINLKTTYTEEGLAVFNAVYRRYTRDSARRGYPFELDKDDVFYLTKQNCHYCGKHPSSTSKTKNDTGDYIYNGIDRLDNTQGYFIDNVVPCCHECNYSKRERTYDNFIKWAHNISKRFEAVGAV